MKRRCRQVQARNRGAVRISVLCAAFVIACLVGILVLYQVRALKEAGPTASPPAPSSARGSANEPKITYADPNAVSPAPYALDLDGQREPTEEEMLRQAIEDYLARMRNLSGPGDHARVLAFARNKAELEALLRSLPPWAVPIIAELLGKETDFMLRRILCEGLAALGTEEAAAVIRDYFLAHASEEAMGSELRHVILALGASDTGIAYDTLIELLGKDEPFLREYRPQYVEALGKHGRGSAALPLFLDLLAGDGRFEVRNKSAQAVKNVAKRDAGVCRAALPQLVQSFESETLLPVRQTTLGAIGQIGDPESIPYLAGVGTRSQELGIRLSAAAAASRIGGEEALRALNEIYANESQKSVLLDAMAQVPTPASVEFLRGVAVNAQSAAERLMAVKALARTDAPEARDALQAVFAVEQDAAVRAEVERYIRAAERRGR